MGRGGDRVEGRSQHRQSGRDAKPTVGKAIWSERIPDVIVVPPRLALFPFYIEINQCPLFGLWATSRIRILAQSKGKMEKYSGARSKDALIEWARTAEPSDDLPGPMSVADSAVSGMVKIIEDLIGVMNKFPIPCVILVVCGMLTGILLGAICCGCGGTVEYRDRPVQYKKRPVSGAVSSNGPPPTDENEEADPKTKKTN